MPMGSSIICDLFGTLARPAGLQPAGRDRSGQLSAQVGPGSAAVVRLPRQRALDQGGEGGEDSGSALGRLFDVTVRCAGGIRHRSRFLSRRRPTVAENGKQEGN